MTTRQPLRVPILLCVLSLLSFNVFARWPAEESLDLPRPEVLIKTDENSAALVSATQDPDNPIDMVGITTVGQLKDKGTRRLMDTLRELRKRKEVDRSGGCVNQEYLKEKIRLVIAALLIHERVKVDPAPIDKSEDCPPRGVKKADVKSGQGLQTATFDTEQGNIRVYLPDDMAAGDTISGTVIAEPNGNTQEERSNNLAKLRGYVVDVAAADRNPTSSIARSDLFVVSVRDDNPNQLSSVITFTVPTKFDMNLFLVPNESVSFDPAQRSAQLTCMNATCRSISQLVFTTPARPLDTSTTLVPRMTQTFVIPTLGQQGRPVVITGPFDGNSANTTVRVSTQADTENAGLLRPLAESPHKAVFEAPTNVTGPCQLTLKEGTGETTADYRNIGVRLSAPKTNLMRSEQTVLTVQVTGLEGIKNPVPLQLDATGVITMDAGNSQNLRITAAEVSRDGTYTTTRAITGQQSGAFNVTASVVVTP